MFKNPSQEQRRQGKQRQQLQKEEQAGQQGPPGRGRVHGEGGRHQAGPDQKVEQDPSSRQVLGRAGQGGPGDSAQRGNGGTVCAHQGKQAYWLVCLFILRSESESEQTVGTCFSISVCHSSTALYQCALHFFYISRFKSKLCHRFKCYVKNINSGTKLRPKTWAKRGLSRLSLKFNKADKIDG